MANHNNRAEPAVMIVTNQLQASPAGGRELLCKLNYSVLKQIYGTHLTLLELPRNQLRGWKAILDAFKGYIDGIDETLIVRARRTIQEHNISKVFVDGSNLGALVKAIKRECPHVETSTFFHNVEARFFLGSLRQTKSFHALAVLLVNYIAERRAVHYSDKIICLSERDSRVLRRVYGRPATHVSSMAVEDKLPSDFRRLIQDTPDRYVLFVGGSFYANRAGILWFVKNVSPHIDIKLRIVGRGMDDLELESGHEGKVEMVGAVDDLAEWYLNARLIVAPIFDGSGMKTKVAEALMFGKKIIGSPEAFSGYGDVSNYAGWVCETADDFVRAIHLANELVKEPFDAELRAIYKARYSMAAAQERLKSIMNS